MAVYVYKCKTCGTTTEIDRLPKDGAVMRHMVGRKVCGTFRRDWSSVSFNRSNLRNH